jgi:chemotaxis protein histidine kinase CheA
MAEHEDPFSSLDDSEVRVVAPDFTLKKLIGEDVDIKQLFSTENVEKAQKTIDSHKQDFLEWIKKDLETLESAYQAAKADLAASDSEIKKLARAAFVVKSQAGTFGYELATHVAKSLDDFCMDHFKPTAQHMTVIRKHIDTLQVIFHKGITGDGGQIGTELTQTLFKLVDKYIH